MYVSPVLAESLLQVIPDLAASPLDVRNLLREQYPIVTDISDSELYSAIGDVLSLQSTTQGKLPLTLLVFDELQQFIGTDSQRTLHVQNVVEACAAQFGSPSPVRWDRAVGAPSQYGTFEASRPIHNPCDSLRR